MLGEAAEGEFRSLEDVDIESVDDNELLIPTVAPVRLVEIVTVEIRDQEDESESVFTGEVTACQPIMTNGTLRHRLVIKVREREEGGWSSGVGRLPRTSE